MTERKARRPALRWRKAKFPGFGMWWLIPTDHMLWLRDHGHDIELWRGNEHLATVNSETFAWCATTGDVPRDRGQSESLDAAKAAAKAAVAS